MTIKKSFFTGKSIFFIFREWGIFFALLLICGLLSLLSPYFLTSNNLFNVLLQAASISIIAAGFTVVLIAGEIDLSIGSAIGLVACVAAVLMIEVGLSPLLGITLSILVGVLLGLFNGLSTVIFRIPSFVVTLSTLGIAHGTGLLLTAGRPVFGFKESYSFIGQGKIGPIPTPVILACVVYAIIHFLLKKTSFGIQLYAVGGNREASEVSGVRVKRIIVLAFVISGVCGPFQELYLVLGLTRVTEILVLVIY